MSGVENPPRRLPGPEIWAEARRRETGRDAARDAAVAGMDPGLWERPLLETLRAAALRQPGRVFLVDAGQTITYGAFWNLVVCLVRQLDAVEAPAGPVAVLASDNVVCAASVFACLGVGRMFMALDVASPAERNMAILRSAGAVIGAFGVVDQAARGIADGLPQVILAGPGDVGDDAAMLACPVAADVDAPAFIMATSGSSGAPKLIVHSQRTMAYRARLYAAGLLATDHIVTASGPPGSYSGMQYMFSAMFVAASIQHGNIRQDGIRCFLDQMRKERASVIRAGASLMRVLTGVPGAQTVLSGLRVVRFGGEPLLHADVAALRPLLAAECWLDHYYASTEAVNLFWRVRALDHHDPVRVSAGFVDMGAEVAILDGEGALCLPGEAGELVIRSRYNALGEWEAGGLVPGRLIPDPSLPGTRVYFTGDLARAGADGCVVVLGRMDRMLKINGQRVEPAEVEAAIRILADVADVTVLPRMVGQSASLAAFVVARSAGVLEARGLRENLRATLPVHMLPSRIVVLEALPRLPSGKVDGVKLLAGLEATTDG